MSCFCAAQSAKTRIDTHASGTCYEYCICTFDQVGRSSKGLVQLQFFIDEIAKM
jgi:hypothetical protein